MAYLGSIVCLMTLTDSTCIMMIPCMLFIVHPVMQMHAVRAAVVLLVVRCDQPS